MLINPETLPEKNSIKVNSIIARWLMNEKKVPLLGKTEDKKKGFIFWFSNTEEIRKYLKEMPLNLKLLGYL